MTGQTARGAELHIRNVSRHFSSSGSTHGFTTALDSVSLDLAAGECMLVGGANGSGKSVLMSIIAGLLAPSSGTVTVTAPDGHTAAAGLVFQDASSQILGETPLEDVMYGLVNTGMKKKEAEQLALAGLKETGLAEKALFPSRTLSGGEKRRLAVAGILAMDRLLVILDEPYANLDYAGVKQVNALISMLSAKGRTVIILTHELEKSLALCTRFAVLYKGRKVFDGTPGEGLAQDLEKWDIRNPLVSYRTVQDLVWN